jgi:predicted transglutaminase-like cysteine proteinase
MKQFMVGSALLMFVWSLPNAAIKDSATSRLQWSVNVEKVAFEQFYGDTLPPIGYVTFCQLHKPDCRSKGPFADRIQLTSARLSEIKQVNDQVNTTVIPMTDLDHYGKVDWWTYPVDGKGDCEDYVLEKRRRLIARGWPESALLITVVRDENNEGHAILTVRTNEGDFVLDNKRRDIMRWTDMPYVFVKEQSQRNPLLWVSLMPPDSAPQPVTASNRR